MKWIVWTVVIFVAYSGWCHLPAWRTPAHLESAVASFLKYGDHTMSDRTLRDKTFQAATSLDLDVPKDAISVVREQPSGERVVRIALEVPVSVRWLGQEKTMMRPVEVEHRFQVNESAERARLDRIAENERIQDHNQRVAARNYERYQRRVKDECSKGNANVQVTSVLVTESDGNRYTVPCDAARRW